ATFLYGALMAINNAGRQTIVPATVAQPALPAAFGLTSAANHTSRIVGPSLSGVLIGAFGVAAALAFMVVVLIVPLLASLRLSPAPAGLCPRHSRRRRVGPGSDDGDERRWGNRRRLVDRQGIANRTLGPVRVAGHNRLWRHRPGDRLLVFDIPDDPGDHGRQY